jgi:hypothetical protein
MNKETSVERLQVASAMLEYAKALIQSKSDHEIMSAGDDLYVRVRDGTLIIQSNGEVSCIPDVAIGHMADDYQYRDARR